MQRKFENRLTIVSDLALKYFTKDIHGGNTSRFWEIWFPRLCSFIIGLFSSILLPHNLPNDFLSYGSSVLAILVGLFITAIIFSYNNFYNSEEINKIRNEDRPDSNRRLLDIQDYNFTKIFAVTTSYTTLYSILTLIFIGIYTLISSDSSELNSRIPGLKDSFLPEITTRFANLSLIYLMSINFLRTIRIVSKMAVFIDDKLERQK